MCEQNKVETYSSTTGNDTIFLYVYELFILFTESANESQIRWIISRVESIRTFLI